MSSTRLFQTFCSSNFNHKLLNFYRIQVGSVIRMHTCAPLSSAVKTPVQKLGWEYLQRQKALNRPLSPHLTIYKPQLTWMVSGFHRITGCVMGGALIIASIGFLVLPFDFTMFIDFVHSLNISAPITAMFKFIIAYPIVFHTLNGIRFLGFDLAKGTDIRTVYKTGWFVLSLSMIISLIVTFMPQNSI